MRIQESKISVFESSKRQEINRVPEMRCCVKLGSLELQRKIVLAHFNHSRPARSSGRDELFKYAKVMACITTATNTFGMSRYLQLILHKLMLCTLGGVS
jgi:hypothetical protein